MTECLRLALIGAGKIADFHVAAAREAGFEVTAVAARKGSTSPAGLAERHGIARVFDGPEELLLARDAWDALLICTSVDGLLDVLERALETKAPILVEKPVAMRSRDLERFDGRELPVMVAYNRRFYPGVRAARAEVLDGPAALGTLTLPESISGWEGPGASSKPLLAHFANSVHGLDLLLFIFGDLTVVYRHLLPASQHGVPGLVATLRSARGDLVQVIVNWRTPANTAITIDRPGRRLELKPYEHLSVYESMRVVEPTPEVPIRTYRPVVAREVPLSEVDIRFKPGLVGQLLAFADLCRGGSGGSGARLSDAKAVLRLAEEISGTTW